MTQTTPEAGAWVLPTFDQLPTRSYVTVKRVNIEWWIANIDSAVFIALAVLGMVVSTTRHMTPIRMGLTELAGVFAIIWAVRLSMTGLGIGPSGVRVYRVWGHRDVSWSEIERFDLTRRGGRVRKDILTIRRTHGGPLTVDRISIPVGSGGRLGSSRLQDPRATAAAESVPGLIQGLNALVAESR